MKFCPKCKQELPDDLEFCGYCGYRFSEIPITKDENFVKPESAPAFEGSTELDLSDTSVLVLDDIVTPKKKSKKKLIWSIISLVLVFSIVIAIFALRARDNDNYCIYVKNDELFFAGVTGKPFQITDNLIKNSKEMTDEDKKSAIDEAAYFCHISRDDKTVFFVDNVSSDDSYTLYYRSLTNKNKDAEKIDSEISSYQISDNSKRLAYKTTDDTLYLYDLKDKDKIAEDVRSYGMSDDGKTIVYLQKTNDDEYFTEGDLYIKKEGKDEDKIASDVTFFDIDEKGSYVYFVDTDDTLYQYKGKDKEKVAENVSAIRYVYKSGEAYYTTKNETSKTLADFVYDDKASTDANMSSYSSEYDNKLKRDEIRNALENSEKITEYALHYYNGKKDTVLSENYVASSYNYDKAVIAYTEFNSDKFEKVKLSEIESEDEIKTLINEAKSDATYTFVAVKDKTNKIEHDDAVAMQISDKGNKICYLVEVEGSGEDEKEKKYDLYTAKISGKKLGKAEVYDTNIARVTPKMTKKGLVYFKNVSEDSMSADLYVNKNKIDSDVLPVAMYNERTNDIFYFTDFDDETEKVTLCKVSGKKGKKIAEDIHDFSITPGGKVFYIADFDKTSKTGNLYLHKSVGKDKKIDDEVQYIIPHSYHSRTY